MIYEKAVKVLAPVEVLVFDKRHCSPSCDYNDSRAHETRCNLFDVALKWDDKRNTDGDLRCPACRKAEVLP